MDLGTAIVAIIIILICIAPFIYINSKNRKREKLLLQSITDAAGHHESKITRYDLWGNSVIGIDEKNFSVYYKRVKEEQEQMEHIQLSQIQKSCVTSTSRVVTEKDGSYKIPEKLDLTLTYHDRSRGELSLEFYNANHDSLILSGELQLVEKWNGILNDAITAHKGKK